MSGLTAYITRSTGQMLQKHASMELAKQDINVMIKVHRGVHFY